MSASSIEGGAVAKGRDPLLRLLAGCAIVVAVLVTLVGVVALLIGWQLARDETPGRVSESFLLGDEAGYWCVDLRPDDAGLNALFARLNDLNETTRREVVRGTFLESIPLPHRRARLDELAPFTLEFALFTREPEHGPQDPRGWAARGTFSRGVFRLRAALKVMRWVLSRDGTKGGTFDVDGLTVTRVHDRNVEFALATVGNRVLVTSDPERMRRVLGASGAAPAAELEPLLGLHRQVRLDGEDAWAFLSKPRVGDWSKPLAIDGASASFDVNDRDELVFRMIVAGGPSAAEGNPMRGTRDECIAVASAFLPGLSTEAIELEGEEAQRLENGELEFSGRVSGVSKRLADLVTKTRENRSREQWNWPTAPERPSATPTPPSPPPRPDPRSDTPAGPTHGGTPTPRR